MGLRKIRVSCRVFILLLTASVACAGPVLHYTDQRRFVVAQAFAFPDPEPDEQEQDAADFSPFDASVSYTSGNHVAHAIAMQRSRLEPTFIDISGSTDSRGDTHLGSGTSADGTSECTINFTLSVAARFSVVGTLNELDAAGVEGTDNPFVLNIFGQGNDYTLDRHGLLRPSAYVFGFQSIAQTGEGYDTGGGDYHARFEVTDATAIGLPSPLWMEVIGLFAVVGRSMVRWLHHELAQRKEAR